MVGEISVGLLVFIGVERNDAAAQADRLLERLLNYRMFNGAAGKMNLSLRDKKDGLLLVPQFTLAADTDSGNRPSFAPAAPPEAGEKLFDYVVAQARLRYSRIATGRYGADMKVSVVNDEPVTFWLRAPPPDRLDVLFACCEWTRVYYLWRPNLPDEADNHLVELAVAGGEDFIVARSLRHLRNMQLRIASPSFKEI